MRTDLTTEALDAAASAIEYPTKKSVEYSRAAAEAFSTIDKDVSEAFSELATYQAKTPVWEQEEMYTRLFDLHATCSLHVGYHVFGEAYQRGALLAGLVGEHRKVGVDLKTELPDYLPTVMRLWARLPRNEETELFHDKVIAAGLSKINSELKKANQVLSRAVCSLGRVFPMPDEAKLEQSQAEQNWEALHA